MYNVFSILIISCRFARVIGIMLIIGDKLIAPVLGHFR